jgi:hypothetical protein
MSAKNRTIRVRCQLDEREASRSANLAASSFGRAGGRSFLFLVEGYSFSDRVSMDAQGFGSFREVRLVAAEGLLYIHLFKLAQCLGQQYVTVKHFINQGLESSSHWF